jgi:hypothetical protein
MDSRLKHLPHARLVGKYLPTKRGIASARAETQGDRGGIAPTKSTECVSPNSANQDLRP